VVAGHDVSGKAIILRDGLLTNGKRADTGLVVTPVWSTDQTPADVWSDEDFGARPQGIQPPPRSSRLSVVDIPPGFSGVMHRTDTLDYVTCLSGSVEMEMPGSPTISLRAGDVMVQQGTDHRWINRSGETCRLAVVLIDALTKPDPNRAGWTAHAKPPGTGPLPDPAIRRVVTTRRDGKDAVMFDSIASNHKWSGRGTVATLVWSTEGCPADIWGGIDQGERILGHQPLVEGSRFSVNDYPPGTPGNMHVTDTLDYAIILAGAIRMDLDDSTVRLGTGDILVQQANNHSWINEGDVTCRIAFVLLDGKKRPGGEFRRPI
jgi:quercetin dioxygenase-like cupin family protein